MDGVIGCAAYEGGCRVADVDIKRAEGGDSCGIGAGNVASGRFVWIGLHEPDGDLLRAVQRRFGLHDLAVEDAHRAHQRPKLEIYDGSVFVVLRTAQLQEDGKIQCGETHIFAGRGYVVTVRHGSAVSYAQVRARCESAPRLLSLGESFVVYSIMDFVVDNYFPIVHALEGEVDALEEAVFAHRAGPQDIERIYELRHELTRLRRAVLPVQEVCARMTRFDAPSLVEREMQPYFRDVQDHAIRVIENIDNLRDLLTSALDANLLFASVQQNDVMKKLAGWAAILAVPTAIAGIYGMNFEHMPELKAPFGYPAVLTVIAVLCCILYYRFKRAGWL